jgi:AraC-like DNA-binding protein
MDKPCPVVYIPDMAQIVCQPKIPSIDLQVAAVEDLVFWTWDEHGYPYWRIYWNDCPGAYILTDQQIEVEPDALTLIAPHTPTKLRLRNPVRHLFLHFVVAPPFHHPCSGVWRFPIGPEMRVRVQKTYEMLRSSPTPPRLPVELMALIAHCLAAMPAGAWLRAPMDRRIHDSVLRIEQELANPLTVEALSQQASMSPAAFARLFRANLNVSPYQYILRRRVEVAALQLGTTDLSIKQIAHACGFCDRYHFTRVFTHFRGISPAAFRQQRPPAAG